MASFVSIAIAARSTAAAALRNAQQGMNNVSNAVRRSSFVTRQHTREVILVAGAYRDINGRLRDANGRWLAEAGNVRIVTTAYGRFVNTLQRATRALYAYAFANRVANAASDRLGDGLRTGAMAIALMGVKISALLAVALPLVGTIGNIVPAIMLIAPAAATAGLGMLAMKLAMSGVKEALDAGLSGDTEAFAKALKKISPQAGDAVKALVHLRDVWKPLVKDFQGRVFEGAASELLSLSRFIKPVVDNWLPKLGLKIAAVRNTLANGLANFSADGRLEGVFRNVYMALASIMDILPSVARIFGDILEVAAPRFSKLSDDARSLAERFADWIREAKESGKLGEWLDKAIMTLGQLKDIATNVGRILGSIFKASSSEGTDMLTQIEQATASIAEWAAGSDGQATIDFFSKLIQYAGQLAPLFDFWVGSIEAVQWAFSALWEGIKVGFRTAVNMVLSSLEMIVVGAARAFGWVPGLGDKLKRAEAEFKAFRDGVNAALDGIQDEVVQITYHSRVIGDRMVSGAQLSGTYSSGIGGRASGGPAAGTWGINEHGFETIDFTRGMVYNSNQTKRAEAAVAAMARSGGGGGGGNLYIEAAPGSKSDWMTQGLLDALIRGRIRLKSGPGGRLVPA